MKSYTKFSLTFMSMYQSPWNLAALTLVTICLLSDNISNLEEVLVLEAISVFFIILC